MSSGEELVTLPPAPGTACDPCEDSSPVTAAVAPAPASAPAPQKQETEQEDQHHHGTCCGSAVALSAASVAAAVVAASSSTSPSPSSSLSSTRRSSSVGPRQVEVEITSDITCPWCFVGLRRFRKAAAMLDPERVHLRVFYRPFSWNTVANAPAGEVRQLDNLRARHNDQLPTMLQTISDAGKGEGITFNFDNALGPNLLAHRLTMLVQRDHPDLVVPWMDSLFSAFFEHQKNVCDVDTLVDLATQKGLDTKAVRAFLHSNELETEVKDEVERSRRKGLKSVPTFDFGGRLQVNGAHEVKTFLMIFKRLGWYM